MFQKIQECYIIFQNVPEDSRMLQNIQEKYTMIQKVLECSTKFVATIIKKIRKNEANKKNKTTFVWYLNQKKLKIEFIGSKKKALSLGMVYKLLDHQFYIKTEQITYKRFYIVLA